MTELISRTCKLLMLGVIAAGCVDSVNSPRLEPDLSPTQDDQKSEVRQVIVNRKRVASFSRKLAETAGYVPIAPIVEALGWTYAWNEATGSITVEQQDGVSVKFTVGDHNVTRNGYPMRISEVPAVVNGEVYLPGKDSFPERAISRVFDLDYAGWDKLQKNYYIYQFPESDQSHSALEKAAIEEAKQHLQRQLIKDITSPPEAAQFPKNIEIQNVQQLTDQDTIDHGLVKVIVGFSVDYRTSSEKFWQFQQSGETRYEHSYLLRFKEGQPNLELVSQRADRTEVTGSPIPFLNESDFVRIGEVWQKENFYSLPEILQITKSIVREVDRPSLSELLTRANTNNSFYLSDHDDEIVFKYFSEAVRNSPGWNAFLKLENARDPIFTVLQASSTKNLISATIIGNWTVDSVSMTPVILDIDFSWDDEIWKITRMENIRLYKNAYELKMQEPRLYRKITEQFVFRRLTDVDPFYF